MDTMDFRRRNVDRRNSPASVYGEKRGHSREVFVAPKRNYSTLRTRYHHIAVVAIETTIPTLTIRFESFGFN